MIVAGGGHVEHQKKKKDSEVFQSELLHEWPASVPQTTHIITNITQSCEPSKSKNSTSFWKPTYSQNKDHHKHLSEIWPNGPERWGHDPLKKESVMLDYLAQSARLHCNTAGDSGQSLRKTATTQADVSSVKTCCERGEPVGQHTVHICVTAPQRMNGDSDEAHRATVPPLPKVTGEPCARLLSGRTVTKMKRAELRFPAVADVTDESSAVTTKQLSRGSWEPKRANVRSNPGSDDAVRGCAGTYPWKNAGKPRSATPPVGQVTGRRISPEIRFASRGETGWRAEHQRADTTARALAFSNHDTNDNGDTP